METGSKMMCVLLLSFSLKTQVLVLALIKLQDKWITSSSYISQFF